MAGLVVRDGNFPEALRRGKRRCRSTSWLTARLGRAYWGVGSLTFGVLLPLNQRQESGGGWTLPALPRQNPLPGIYCRYSRPPGAGQSERHLRHGVGAFQNRKGQVCDGANPAALPDAGVVLPGSARALGHPQRPVAHTVSDAGAAVRAVLQFNHIESIFPPEPGAPAWGLGVFRFRRPGTCQPGESRPPGTA